MVNKGLLYSAKVMADPLLPKFRVSPMEVYDGTQDPMEHFKTFKAHMMLHGYPVEVACKAFRLTLRVLVRIWFSSLVGGSIENFDELVYLFLSHFTESRRRRHPAAFLFTIKQREDENLKAHLAKFNKM